MQEGHPPIPMAWRSSYIPRNHRSLSMQGRRLELGFNLTLFHIQFTISTLYLTWAAAVNRRHGETAQPWSRRTCLACRHSTPLAAFKPVVPAAPQSQRRVCVGFACCLRFFPIPLRALIPLSTLATSAALVRLLLPRPLVRPPALLLDRSLLACTTLGRGTQYDLGSTLAFDGPWGTSWLDFMAGLHGQTSWPDFMARLYGETS